MECCDENRELCNMIIDSIDNNKNILFCLGGNIKIYYGRIIGVTDEFKRRDYSGDGDNDKVSNKLEIGNKIL